MAVALDDALRMLDRTEANLVRLEKVWGRMKALISGNEGETLREELSYEDLRRSFIEIRNALPSIDSWSLTATPYPGLNDIAYARFEAQEVDEPSCYVETEKGIFEADGDLQEYRYHLGRKRRGVVRARLNELLEEVDTLLLRLQEKRRGLDVQAPMPPAPWKELENQTQEVDRLLGSAVRNGRWDLLWRHLSWAQAGDLDRIVAEDWPSVRSDIEIGMFLEHEPLPIDVTDLSQLSGLNPKTPVALKLEWNRLNEEGFERLIFNLISEEKGYENVDWLTKTHAPDKGRDVGAYRIHEDPLSGSRRLRTIVQCRHWTTKSLGVDEIAAVSAQMKLWEPPVVDILVFATSGSFTVDAVQWIEKTNYDGRSPRIEMWAGSHLERLLTRRPHLITEFCLR